MDSFKSFNYLDYDSVEEDEVPDNFDFDGEPIDLVGAIEKKSEHQFRFNAKSVFLTYPKCHATKIDCANALQALPAGVECAMISQEHHKDGTPHLHAWVELKKKINTTDNRYFDFMGYHPNISVVRNKNAVQNYLVKEDLLPYTINFDASAVKPPKKGSILIDACSAIVKDGVEVYDLVLGHPSLLLNYDRLTKCRAMFMRDKAKRDGTLAGHKKPEFRAYFIFGPPGIGKTYSVVDYFGDRLYRKCCEEKYWNGYDPARHEAVLIDEFSPRSLEPFVLKQISDRYVCRLPVKNEDPAPGLYKTLILTSNFAFNQCFTNDDNFLYSAMSRRFIIANANEERYKTNGWFDFGKFLTLVSEQENLV